MKTRTMHSYLHKPREPVFWFRQRSAIVPVTGVAGSVAIFVPQAVTTGSVDTGVTILRVKLSLTVSPSPGAVNDLGHFGVMALLGSFNGAAALNPALPAAVDQRGDWMYLKTAYLGSSAALGESEMFNKDIDIKTKRKLEQDDDLRFCWATTFAGGAGTQLVNLVSSVLWQRTLRH